MEPSKSDAEVAELVKYKEALLRARRRLSDLNQPRLPERITIPTVRIVEESENESSEEKDRKVEEQFVFKGLKKSKVHRSQLSFDQVYFDRENGVKLPILRRGDGSDEEDNHDTVSFISLPAVMDYQREISLDDSENISTQTPVEESGESATPLVDQGIKMEVETDESGVREHSIEEIRASIQVLSKCGNFRILIKTLDCS